MPDGTNGDPGRNAEIIKPESGADLEPQLPPVNPPSTKAPVQFNQQVNFYQQIPQTAWDRLAPEHIVDLSKAIIAQIDVADKRQFDYAMEHARKEQSGKRLAII